MKTFKFRTRENTDVFISLDDNIYGIHSKRMNILYVWVCHTSCTYTGPWVNTSLLVILSWEWLTGRIMFALNWPSIRIYQRYQSSRRGPKAGGSLHPLLASGLASPQLLDDKPPTRSTPTVRREVPEKEISPPALQTLEINTPDTITVTRPPKTAQLTPSPCIKKPATPAPSPETPRPKRPRMKSPKYTNKQPTQFFHVNIEDEYPLHEKYDLQDVHATTYKVIIKATRLPREDEELNIDLPVFFVYQKENKHWSQIKGSTSKFYDDPWYTNIEMLMGATGVRQTNMAYWYDVLEKSHVEIP